MSQLQIAAPNQRRIVPAFTVRKLEGKVERPLIRFDAKGKKYTEMVKADAGYLVTFPTKGHSIRVKDAEELKRLGFDKTIPLVEDGTDNDDVVGYVPNSVVAA
jgi:hypothetical protein